MLFHIMLLTYFNPFAAIYIIKLKACFKNANEDFKLLVVDAQLKKIEGGCF